MAKRKYRIADVKILYGRAAAMCAFPSCRKICSKDATKTDSAIALGRIAHIHAHSPGGPRFNQNLNSDEIDSYQNWILLCADCHDIIDKQAQSYPSDFLFKLKEDHEAWVEQRLRETTPNISFKELSLVCEALAENPTPPSKNFTLISPEDKIKKNGLSDKSTNKITIGMIKANEVRELISRYSQLNNTFPEKLISGFINKYNDLKSAGIFGDALFEELHSFASLYKSDFDTQSAGLSVLVYLFESCEVFEK